jgi:hypothetical protein
MQKQLQAIATRERFAFDGVFDWAHNPEAIKKISTFVGPRPDKPYPATLHHNRKEAKKLAKDAFKAAEKPGEDAKTKPQPKPKPNPQDIPVTPVKVRTSELPKERRAVTIDHSQSVYITEPTMGQNHMDGNAKPSRPYAVSPCIGVSSSVLPTAPVPTRLAAPNACPSTPATPTKTETRTKTRTKIRTKKKIKKKKKRKIKRKRKRKRKRKSRKRRGGPAVCCSL